MIWIIEKVYNDDGVFCCMKYAVGYNWEEDLVDFAKNFEDISDDKIFEFFGSPAFSFFGGATTYPRIKDVSLKEVEDNVRYVKENGFKFNYLINSSVFPEINSDEDLDKAIEYLNWIKRLGPDIVTVGNEEVLDFVMKYFPEFKINLSIVLAIKSLERAEVFYKKYSNVERVTFHQTINRDVVMLKKHIKLAHSYDIEVELLVNEICLHDCPRMKDHYDYLGKISQSDNSSNLKFFGFCCGVRRKNPLEFLNACWIRPEDVQVYEDMGVDILKIAGRGESVEYLELVMKAYMTRKYSGNIMDLFYSVWWTDGKIPFVDNSLLNGFLEYLFASGKVRLDEVPEEFNIEYKF